MKIAITGGKGFVGRYLADRLLIQHECAILSRTNCDYSKMSLLEYLRGCDAVVHLASERDKENILENFLPNISITDNLLTACSQLKIHQVVIASSISVYGKNDTTPWTESSPLLPATYYALSKVFMEKQGLFFMDNTQTNVKILRIPQIIGVGEREGYLLDIFVKRARQNLPLEVYGKGIGRREYIYVKDVCSAIEKALTYPKIKGIYNIGTGVSLSHLELAQMINQVFANQGNIIRKPEIKADESVSIMSSKRFRDTFDWRPEWDLFSAFKDVKMILEDVSS